jgi:iron complex outermembrane receptor protein
VFNAVSGFGITGSFADPLSFAAGSDGAVHTRSYAAYAQVDYDVLDKLTLTLGGRYTDETKDLVRNRVGSGPADTLGQAINDEIVYSAAEPLRSLKFDKFVPKVTLSYRPTKGLLVYGTYSVGFKSGGFNLPEFPSDEVKPEIVKDFEGGVKFESSNIRFNAAGFHYNFDNRQVQTFSGTVTRTTNAASARVNGFEADATWVPVRPLELSAGLGYVDAKYTNYIGQAVVPCANVASLPSSTPAEAAGIAAAEAGCTATGGLGLATVGGQDLSGRKLEATPSFTGYARAAYNIDLHSLGNVTLSAIVNYRSTAYFDPANIYPDNSRTMLSARIAWTSPNGKLTASVYGENITGDEYNMQVFPLALGGFRVPGPPASVNVEVGYRF